MDPFANLGVKSSNKAASTLSLQERQKQQLAEKARQAEERQRASDADAAFWDSFGNTGQAAQQNGNGKKPGIPPPPGAPADKEEEDLFKAFNSSAPVDASSHFPPPNTLSVPSSSNASRWSSPVASPPPAQNTTQAGFDDNDDDPFGLGAFEKKRTAQPIPQQTLGDDDDFLGDLGKPVGELPKRTPRTEEPRPTEEKETISNHPADGAVAELMDMGFPADKSREALAHTESGTDVQAAVGWLLNQAHAETGSRNKARSQEQSRDASRGRPSRTESPANGQPSWLRGSGTSSRQDDQSPASRERDPAKVASEIGSNLAKTAGSFWKSARKTAQKAMADFQQPEGDSSQPKWMREAQAREEAEQRQARRVEEAKLTDEAMMLDMPAPERTQKQAQNGRSTPQSDTLRTAPAMGREGRASPFDRDALEPRPLSRTSNQGLSARPRPSEKLTRQQVEEQSAQAYVSSARRRKPQPTEPKPVATSEPPPEPKFASAEAAFDIFNAPPPAASTSSKPSSSPANSTPRTSTPIAVRPKAPLRSVPQTSPSALSNSHADRQKGTEAFKRGDYATAQSHYTSALSSLPTSHPILIVLHCNRALTNIKTGDPKQAIADADAALAIIGPSRGEAESIALHADEGDKPMKDFFGKALMRKAEAYEHMEKWPDAARAWRDAVEAGVGGAVAIQARNRCEKAAAPKSSSSSSAAAAAASRPPAAKKPAAAAAPRKSALADLNGGGGSGGESEAVKRLRAANLAATAASDEQFALTDAVTARLDAWRGSKKDNLRALLASLDAVLWADAGWKSVGMGDLVMPPRVKVVYMKAIAKVHPDKLSQTATTEQKMISAAVFASLNEAWDKFKADNGL